MLCQGRGDWASRLPQSYNHRSVIVMYKSSGGATDGSYWLEFIPSKYRVMNIVSLKLKMVQVIGGFMDTDIRINTSQSIEGSRVKAHEMAEFQVKRCVTHMVLYPSGSEGYYWY